VGSEARYAHFLRTDPAPRQDALSRPVQFPLRPDITRRGRPDPGAVTRNDRRAVLRRAVTVSTPSHRNRQAPRQVDDMRFTDRQDCDSALDALETPELRGWRAGLRAAAIGPKAAVRRKIIVAWKLSLTLLARDTSGGSNPKRVLSREQLSAHHAPNLVARSNVVLDSISTGYLGALSLTPGRSSGRAINAVRSPFAAAALRSSL
jgi:hypothetical protein